MTPLLRFDITWTDPPGEHHEAGLALAWGAGVLYVGEAPVWFVGNADAPQPVAWSWIELLEWRHHGGRARRNGSPIAARATLLALRPVLDSRHTSVRYHRQGPETRKTSQASDTLNQCKTDLQPMQTTFSTRGAFYDAWR